MALGEVLFCTDSPGLGGAELSLVRVLRMVGPEGVTLVHTPDVGPYLVRYARGAGIGLHCVSGGNRLTSALAGVRGAFRLAAAHPHARFVLWAHHPDSFRWIQLGLALAGSEYVVAERVVPTSRSAFARSRLSIPLKRVVASRARAIVVNGASQAQQYARVFGVPGSKIRVISGSRDVVGIGQRVDALRRDLVGLRSGLGLPEGPLAVCVGRLTAQKGQRVLIGALGGRSLARAGLKLVLVGDGPERAALEAEASECAPGRVVFAGHQDDPLPWLAAADCFALASRYEGLPGALIEAMAARLSCVATDIPGNRDLIVHNQTGLLVPVDDAGALEQSLAALIASQEDRRRLGDAAEGWVRARYDEAIEGAEWVRLLRS